MKNAAVTARSVPMLLLLAANALFATCTAKSASATPQLSSVDTNNPSNLVSSLARATLTPMDAHRDEYRNNPAELGKLRDAAVLPHFDSRFAARLVLGPYWRSATAAAYATVDTIVTQSDGSRTNVRYSLHRTKEGRKVYDMTFDGVSYLANFRNDYREEIEQKGLDELISRLERDYG